MCEERLENALAKKDHCPSSGENTPVEERLGDEDHGDGAESLKGKSWQTLDSVICGRGHAAIPAKGPKDVKKRRKSDADEQEAYDDEKDRKGRVKRLKKTVNKQKRQQDDDDSDGEDRQTAATRCPRTGQKTTAVTRECHDVDPPEMEVKKQVHFTLEDGGSEGVWRLLADVYLCAVLICSLGLLSIFLFTLVLTCQYFHRRHRLKASYLLVKCPESSSGETVTSSSSSSSSPPRAQRKVTIQKPDRRVAVTPPKLPEEPPPHIPAKVPVAAKRPQKPRRLKTHLRSSTAAPRAQEDSLTYAELELVRPRPEPPASSSPDPAPSSPDTVYAQILFQEKQL